MKQFFSLGGFLGLISLLAAALFIGGCQNQSHGTKVVELTFWNGFSGPDGKTMGRIVDDYNRSHPGVHVKMQIIPWGTYYDKLTLGLAFGGAPDVFILHEVRVPEFASHGALKEVENYPGIDMNDFSPRVRTVGIWDGKRYGLPLDCHPIGMYYNVGLFRAAGIEHPPTNFEQFIADAKKLTKPGQWGTEISDIHLQSSTFLDQFDAHIYGPGYSTATLDSPQARAAVNAMLSLSDTYHVSPPPQGNDAWLGFQMGKVGMVFQGTWMVDSLRDKKDLEFAAAPVPQFGTIQAVWASSHTLCMPARLNPERTAAAENFIAYLSDHSLEWARGGQVPVRLTILNSKGFQELTVMKEFAKELPYIVYEPAAVTINQVAPFADEAVEASLNHIDKPSRLLELANRRIENVLKRQ